MSWSNSISIMSKQHHQSMTVFFSLVFNYFFLSFAIFYYFLYLKHFHNFHEFKIRFSCLTSHFIAELFIAEPFIAFIKAFISFYSFYIAFITKSNFIIKSNWKCHSIFGICNNKITKAEIKMFTFLNKKANLFLVCIYFSL